MGQLALHRVGMRALGAAVEVPAQPGDEIGREPALLELEELIAHVMAIHGRHDTANVRPGESFPAANPGGEGVEMRDLP